MQIEAVEESVNYLALGLEWPLWKATELAGSGLRIENTAFKSIAIFASSVAGFAALPLYFTGRLLTLISDSYFKRNFIKITSANKTEGSPKTFLSFNVCMMPGILSQIFGGMTPASQRVNQLAQFIKAQRADVVSLQELTFAGGGANQLIQQIKDVYPHIFYRIGPNNAGMENGLFFASRIKPISENYIPFQEITGRQYGFKRGFFVAQFEDQYVISTHLDPGRGTVRAEQIKAIIEYKKGLSKPILLMGDLNIEPEDAAAHALLAGSFANYDSEAAKHIDETNGTYLSKEQRWLQNDHILTDRKIQQIVIPAFGDKYKNAPLSDHHAVLVRVNA